MESAAAAELFHEQRELIKKIVRHVAWCWSLRSQDAEDFEQDVHEKLIEDDYAVLRRFERRSSLETYLTTVINRHFLDGPFKPFAKWRPSALARRIGGLAVDLERLVLRDACTLDEAARELSRSRNEHLTADDLSPILERLPVRRPRSEPIELDEQAVATREPGPEAVYESHEAEETAVRLCGLLERAIDSLDPDDQMLVRLTFGEGLSVARIAVMLGREQQPLYRILARCLKDMRRYLEANGVSASDVDSVLEPDQVLVQPVKNLRRDAERGRAGPSHTEGGPPDAGRRGERRRS